MNLDVLKTVGGPTVQKAALKVSKYAPEILTGVGVVSGIAGTIMIAKASVKVSPIVEEFRETRDFLHLERDEAKADTSLVYDEHAYQKQLVGLYAKYAAKLIKHFGPGAGLAFGSIVAHLGAHGLMHQRQVALIGAYNAVQSAFTAYRSRVVEEYGTEKDEEFRFGIRTEKIENPETGKKTTVKSIDPNHHSQYGRWFDEGNENYQRQPGYNFLFVKNMQNWANDRLHKRGFLFLNEVYKDLGFDQTPEGQLVGWVTGPEGKDRYIDFGVFVGDDVRKRAFVNGDEQSIFLDFNVDGVIIDLI